MITGIKIEKLFGIFDYDIEFNEGITILTGPNGYGKTTVLKIIDALVIQNACFFLQLLFHKIVLTLSTNESITLEKKNRYEVLVITTKPEPIAWSIASLANTLLKELDYHCIGIDKWIDNKGRDYTADSLIKKLSNECPELPDGLQLNPRPKLPPVYFIREQRLLRAKAWNRITSNGFGFEIDRPGFEIIGASEGNSFTNTIEVYAKELRENIKDTLAKSSQINQELDSSFPRRLFDQTIIISEDEFRQRFNKVKQIQKLLNEFGLSDVKEDSHPTYKAENAKALAVYIEDTEKKLEVFDELLTKLKIFTEILNGRRFAFKRLDISRVDGFKLSTDRGTQLALADLSSGEQQEVVMLYELLFKVNPGALVLIDEPELSLHVVWQKQFLDDLFQIIKLKKINMIIATHSPQIINNHWDLTVDLEELRNAAISR